MLLDLLSVPEFTMVAREAPRVLSFDEWRKFLDQEVSPAFERDLRAAMIEGEIEPEPPEPLAAILTGAIVTAAARVSADEPADVAEQYRAVIRRIILRLKTVVPVG